MSPTLERLLELLAEGIVRKLTPAEDEERRRLVSLLRDDESLDWSDDELELAAAAVELCWMPSAWKERADEEMLERLDGRLFDQARGFFAGAVPPKLDLPKPDVSKPDSVGPARVSAGMSLPLAWGGWIVAAAAMALWLFLPLADRTDADVTLSAGPLGSTVVDCARLCPESDKGEKIEVAEPSVAELRERLLNHASTVRFPWTSTKDPLSDGVRGDVVWNGQEQRGYMHFSGLPTNDPQEAQYQLWIFDQGRDEAHPVDGGTFDVIGGEVIVTIDPRVPIHEATLFAVTLEKPGGVVVSTRERLIVLAQPG